MTDTKHKLIHQLSALSPVEVFTFVFYNTHRTKGTLDILPDKIGSVSHLNYLKELLAKEKTEVHKSLKELSRFNFKYLSTKMVNLSHACQNLGTYAFLIFP